MSESSLSNLLEQLFVTKTITPSYKKPHILYVIMLLGRESRGIGRYKLKKEVFLGEGSIKTLLNRLKEEKIIAVDETRQKGHILTNKGQNIYKNLIKLIPLPKKLENEEDKFVVGQTAYFTIIKHSKIHNPLGSSIKQRDEAIKMGGTGATCLTYNGQKKFRFSDGVAISIPIDLAHIHENDLIIIGAGNSKTEAILATYAAAISIIKL